MKALLVDPLIESACAYPSLGLMSIAAVLEEKDIPVSIAEMRFFKDPLTDIKNVISKEKPDIIGITTMSYTFPTATEVARIAKDVVPECVTIFGGPHVTFLSREVLRENPMVDIIVLGEGEYTMLELARTLAEKKAIKKVRGIAFREKKRITKTSQRSLIKDLDILPFPARHLVSMNKYRASEDSTPLTSARGCPFRCIFCAGRVMWGPKVRFRSSENIIAEIEYIIKNFGFKAMSFVDDVFTLDKIRTINICASIIERSLDIEWECSTRPDLLTRGLMENMKRAGCRSIFLGIESGCQKTLDTLGKGITLEQTKKIIMWAKEIEIQTRLSFMLGCPGENTKDVLETIKFAKNLKKLGAGTICFSFLKIYPGTILRKQLRKFGITFVDRDWGKYGSPLLPTCATKEIAVSKLCSLALYASRVEYFLNENFELQAH